MLGSTKRGLTLMHTMRGGSWTGFTTVSCEANLQMVTGLITNNRLGRNT